MSYIQCTCNIIYTKFLVVHLLYYNNYVGSMKVSDRLLVSADIYMQLSAIRLLVKIYIGTSLILSIYIATGNLFAE